MIANPRVSHRLLWRHYAVLLAALAVLPCWLTFTQAQEAVAEKELSVAATAQPGAGVKDKLKKLNIELQEFGEPDRLSRRISQYEFAYRMQIALPTVFRGKAFIVLDENAKNVVIKAPKEDQAEILRLIEK